MKEINDSDVDKLYRDLDVKAEKGGYHLNPDADDTRTLLYGLLVNRERYGYPSCPCREAEGSREKDLDIICPCDYRDPDLFEYGTCYCGLYVSEEILSGEKKTAPIPERRTSAESNPGVGKKKGSLSESPLNLKYPVWRCKVCGYLCARENPPAECPVCHADGDRFEILFS